VDHLGTVTKKPPNSRERNAGKGYYSVGTGGTLTIRGFLRSFGVRGGVVLKKGYQNRFHRTGKTDIPLMNRLERAYLGE